MIEISDLQAHSWNLALKYYVRTYFATMIRSGTWYAHFLFENLDMNITGRQSINETHGIHVYDGLQCIKSHNHSIFPSFPELYDGPLRENWDQLVFYCETFNFHYINVIELPELFSPIHNPNLKIVYLFRNPLDNCVSAYHHYKNHPNKSHSHYRDKISGEFKPFSSPSNYMRNGGLEGYIKQFFTHYAMRKHTNLLMVRYEDLIREPTQTFLEILSFIGVSTEDTERRLAITKAVEQSSPDQIRQMEMRIGHSLANDQNVPLGSQMHGGVIGKWKMELSAKDVNYCDKFLERFNIDRSQFVFD